MKDCDAVAGMEVSRLNFLIQRVYTKLYPTIFKGEITINQLGIKSVEYDIAQSPIINLNPTGTFRDIIRCALDKERLDYGMQISDALEDKIIEDVKEASIGLVMGKVKLKISYIDPKLEPTFLQCSIEAIIAIKTVEKEERYYIGARIISAHCEPKDDPIMDMVNKAFIPYLIERLNTQLITLIEIPQVIIKKTNMGLPLFAKQPPHILTFTAIGSQVTEPPEPYQWPTDFLFIGLDAKVFQTVIGKEFPKGLREHLEIGPLDIYVVAEVDVKKVEEIFKGRNIRMQFQLELKIRFDWTFIVSYSFELRVTATFNADIIPYYDQDTGVLSVTFSNVQYPNIKIDTSGIPKPLRTIINLFLIPIETAIGIMIGNWLKLILASLRIDVVSIPWCKILIQNQVIWLKLVDVKIEGGGPDSRYMLVQGDISII